MRSDAITKRNNTTLVSAAVTTVQLFPDPNNALLPAIITLEASGAFEQIEFEVAASGNATTVDANTTVTIGLYGATAIPASPLVAANWTLLGAGTARVVNTTSCPWKYRAKLIADALSGKLHGEFCQTVNNLYDAYAAVSSVVTGVNLAGTAEPALFFCLGLTFGVNGKATNIGRNAYFGIEC